MSSTNNLLGRWLGVYLYDVVELNLPEGSGVPFELNVSQTWWQRPLGLFSGQVCDDPVLGVPGEGSLHGRFCKGSLRFTKNLPAFYLGAAGHSITLQDYLREQGLEFTRSVAHPPIYYRGTLTADGQVTGTWEMHACTLRFATEGFELPLLRSTGTFTMKRSETVL